jgi:hypothetical protein
LRSLSEFVDSNNLSQTITKDTWYRNINGIIKSSRIDHIYTSENLQTSSPTHIEAAYSDHQIIKIGLLNIIKLEEEDTPVWTRSWYGYSSEKLLEKLRTRDWNTEINNIQGHYDWLI